MGTEKMGTADSVTALRRMFAPRSIAVVGASEDTSRIGGRVLANARWAFAGPVFPVSRGRSTVQGLPAVAALSDLPEVPDLVIVAVSATGAAEVVAQAATAGAAGVVVLTSGFAETGADGEREQRRLRDLARAGGTRLLGPNTIGFINPRSGAFATFLHNAAQETPVAPIALITQSGAISAYLLRMMRGGGVGLSLQCASGNEADISATEVIELAIDDPGIELILACVEGVRDVPRLMAAGRRARELGKTILLLKIGTSQAGARAAASHSGALSSDAEAFRAAIRHAGIVEVATVAELARFGPLFLGGRRPAGPRLGIVTTSGGLGIHVADQAAQLGLEVPLLPESDQRVIAAALPAYASAANPVDVTGNIINDPESLRAAATAVMRSAGIDSALVYATNVGVDHEAAAFSAIADAHAASDKPMLALAHDDQSAAALMSRGVPAISDAGLAVRGLAAAYAAARRKTPRTRRALPATDGPVEQAAALLAAGPLSPDRAFWLLERFGITPVPYAVADNVGDAVKAAANLGGPVAVKLAVAEVAHKSDIGGVALDLRHGVDVADAAARLLAVARRAEIPARLLIQRMAPAGVELFAGVYRAAGIGPALVIGLGGLMVEITGETATVLACADDDEIRDAVSGLCGGRLTAHRRGLSPAGLDAVVAVLGRVATLALSVDELGELDLNPIVVSGGNAAVVDAVCRPALSPENSSRA